MPEGLGVGIRPKQTERRESVCIVGRKGAFISSATTFDNLRKKFTDKNLPFGVLAMLLNVGNNKKIE
jgi:hypothetical protein